MGRGWNAVCDGTPFERGLRRGAAHHSSVRRRRSDPGAPSISPLFDEGRASGVGADERVSLVFDSVTCPRLVRACPPLSPGHVPRSVSMFVVEALRLRVQPPQDVEHTRYRRLDSGRKGLRREAVQYSERLASSKRSNRAEHLAAFPPSGRARVSRCSPGR